MIRRINVFPANVRSAAVVRGGQVPVNVLIGYGTARIFNFKVVGRRVAR